MIDFITRIICFFIINFRNIFLTILSVPVVIATIQLVIMCFNGNIKDLKFRDFFE